MTPAQQRAISVLATAVLAVESGSPIVSDLADSLNTFFRDLTERPTATAVAALLATAACSFISATTEGPISEGYTTEAVRAAASTFVCAVACIGLCRTDVEKIADVLVEIAKVMEEQSPPGSETSHPNPMNN